MSLEMCEHKQPVGTCEVCECRGADANNDQQQKTTCDCGGEMLGGICLFCGWWAGRTDQPPGELRNGTHYHRDGSPMPFEQPFVAWVAQVQAEAKRRVGRDDVEWLIGDERDMREGFKDDMTPDEYVQQQVENID